ncbi:MAG: undecaprenyldiphospho-muramoylpentapeptide beta-N-acetylglucosaminyltransferase [Candidatus Omnitrophica bacterium]|nr:undecaprenyldiphospho-muramoylpentapeptide beta-N-acetylglucosaminyltransferase [Candidatus Omnitrophota bacterium]
MRILLATGASAGHIFPAWAVAVALNQQAGPQILLVLSKRNSELIGRCAFPCVYIDIRALKKEINLQNTINLLKLGKSLIQSLGIILKFRPDVVVGFGGYASFFLVFFAWLFRIKTIIHEQNVLPGLSNRILGNFVDKIAISFPESRCYLRFAKEKIQLTGNPLQPDLVRIEKWQARDLFGFRADKFTILVMGGSQGSHSINSLFIKALELSEEKFHFQIIHLCGGSDFSFLEEAYQRLKLPFRLYRFNDMISFCYCASDLVISRAGAASMGEIMFFGLASILIPYPYAGNHQLENAKILSKNKGALVFEEKDLSPEILADAISGLFRDSQLRHSLAEEAANLSEQQKDAAGRLAKLILT